MRELRKGQTMRLVSRQPLSYSGRTKSGYSIKAQSFSQHYLILSVVLVVYSNDNKSENIGFETSPLLFRCLSVLLLITEMSAKDLAATAIEKGMSICGAAQVFGIHFSKLQNRIAMQNRPSFTDARQKEALIAAALESVAEKRLSLFSAAKPYGIEYN